MCWCIELLGLTRIVQLRNKDTLLGALRFMMVKMLTPSGTGSETCKVGMRNGRSRLFRGVNYVQLSGSQTEKVQGPAKRRGPGCVNAAGKARHKWYATDKE